MEPPVLVEFTWSLHTHHSHETSRDQNINWYPSFTPLLSRSGHFLNKNFWDPLSCFYHPHSKPLNLTLEWRANETFLQKLLFPFWIITQALTGNSWEWRPHFIQEQASAKWATQMAWSLKQTIFLHVWHFRYLISVLLHKTSLLVSSSLLPW